MSAPPGHNRERGPFEREADALLRVHDWGGHVETDRPRPSIELVRIRKHSEHTRSVTELLQVGESDSVRRAWKPVGALPSQPPPHIQLGGEEGQEGQEGPLEPHAPSHEPRVQLRPARPHTAGPSRGARRAAFPTSGETVGTAARREDGEMAGTRADGGEEEAAAAEAGEAPAEEEDPLRTFSPEAAHRLKALAASLEQTELFAGIPPNTLRRLVAGASVRVLPRYQVIYRAGARAQGQALYVWLPAAGGTGSVLLNGAATDEEAKAAAARAYADAAAATVGTPRAAFGAELATPLAPPTPAAVVFGLEGCALSSAERGRADTATVEGGAVTVLLLSPSALPREVASRATELANERLLARVRAQHLFAEAEPVALRALLRHTQLRHFEPGQLAAQEGDDANALYTVVRGALTSWVSAERGGSGGGTGARAAGGLGHSERRAGAAGRERAPIVLDAAAPGTLVHYGLEAVSAWLATGETGRTKLLASYRAVGEGADVLVVPASAFQELLEAVGGLGAKVEAGLVALDRQRARAAQAAQRSVELEEMRRQCREASWNRFGAPIDSQIDLMRVFGRPTIPVRRG